MQKEKTLQNVNIRMDTHGFERTDGWMEYPYPILRYDCKWAYLLDDPKGATDGFNWSHSYTNDLSDAFSTAHGNCAWDNINRQHQIYFQTWKSLRS